MCLMSLAAYFDFRLFLDQICKKEKRKKEKKTRKKERKVKKLSIKNEFTFVSSTVFYRFFDPFLCLFLWVCYLPSLSPLFNSNSTLQIIEEFAKFTKASEGTELNFT